MSELLFDVLRWAQVAFGIGLVIFVHEAGHFLMARWCGVRVETFSLGFGPKLLGWRRGATLYQIAAVPLGGFVRMAGEDAAAKDRPPAADELQGKSVGQRFLIFSGGVIANVLFALVVFPFLLASGVPMTAPVIGAPAPGSPAWHAGLTAGTRVLSVNGREVIGFQHIAVEVALGSPEQALLLVEEPGGARRSLRLVPVWDEILGAQAIGVGPAVDPDGLIEVVPGSPAARAGLRSGDRLLRFVGPPDTLGLLEQFSWATRAGGAVTVEILRDGTQQTLVVEPERVPASKKRLLGVLSQTDVVRDLRESPRTRALGLRRGDRLMEVNGRKVRSRHDLLSALLAEPGEALLRVEREGSQLRLTAPCADEAAAVALAGDLYLADDPGAARIVVPPGSAAAEAGLLDGDRIVAVAGTQVGSFLEVPAAVQAAAAGPVGLTVLRAEASGTEQRLEFSVTPRPLLTERFGFDLRQAQYVYRTDGPLDAVRVGLASSWKLVEESWLTVKRIVLGQVSGKSIGGIITIGVVSDSFAKGGLVKLLFFLCMLSMNLAFLNVLPIPVLDGGHLLFLLVEKLKGSPVDERVMGYSQMVGLVLIVSLMVYVTFNDVMRWIVG